MKTLELKLKKDVLIVEFPSDCDWNLHNDSIKIYNKNKVSTIKGNYEFLCKGSELTEEIASELVEFWQNMANDGFIYENYNTNIPKKKTSVESFISAVESKGFYLLENPMSPYIPVIDKKADENYMKKYFEAEEKTFKNPLIFVKK